MPTRCRHALLVLLVTLWGPGAAAAEAYGFFSCSLTKDGAEIFVSTTPARYGYPPPPPKDGSVESIVDFTFAEADAFKKAHAADVNRFQTRVEEVYGVGCSLAGDKTATFAWGPFQTMEEVDRQLNLQIMTQEAFADATKKAHRNERLRFE